jgi:hypothetical protein
MAIQLRNQTQQTVSPSALSHGVGLPISDGGLGAVAQAVSQVAGLAGNLVDRKKALNNQAITDATNTYQQEVTTQVNAASAAAKAEDTESYEAAVTALDELGKAPVASFAQATDKPLNIKDDQWQSTQIATDKWYNAQRGALDVSTINSKFTARLSRGLTEVGSTSTLNISEGAVGTSGMMELIDKSDKLTTGDLAKGATAPALDGLSKDLTRYAEGQVSAFASSKSKYTSVTAWNNDVDIMKDMVSQSVSYGQYQGKLMKVIESLRVAEPKEKQVSLNPAAKNQFNQFNETIESGDFGNPKQIESLEKTLNNLSRENLTEAARADVNSKSELLSLVKKMGTLETRGDIINYFINNPEKTPLDFVNDLDPNNEVRSTMNAGDNTAFMSHLSGVVDSVKNAQLESFGRNPNTAGLGTYNKTAIAAAMSPENAIKIQEGTNLQNQALNAYDLYKPEAAMGFIREANKKFSIVTSTDYGNEEFVGLNTTVMYLKANSDNPKALAKAVGVTQAMLGEKRTFNLVSSHTDSDKTPELNELVAGLRNNVIFNEDQDVKIQEYALVGANREEWKAKNKSDTAAGQKFNQWEAAIKNPEFKIHHVIQDLGALPQPQAKWWSDVIVGSAITKMEDDSNISLAELSNQISKQVKSRVQIHEAYGNTSVVLMAHREDGSFSSPAINFFTNSASFGLGVQGAALTKFTVGKVDKKIKEATDMYRSRIISGNLTGEEYVTGQLHRAVLRVVDSGILDYNLLQHPDKSVASKIQNLAPPAEVLLKMMRNGDVMLSDTVSNEGVSMRTLKVRVPIKEEPNGLKQILFTGGDESDFQWVNLVNAEGKAFPLASSFLDITSTQYQEDVARIEKITRYKPFGSTRGIFLPDRQSQSPEAVKARSERVRNIFDSIKDIF